jgi:hypothetical protein
MIVGDSQLIIAVSPPEEKIHDSEGTPSKDSTYHCLADVTI